MSTYAASAGWDHGITFKASFGKWGDWSWSYHEDFLPYLHAACPPKAYLRFFGQEQGE